jgi:hypothetical protein
VTTADLLVLAPWLIFGASLGAIGFRLLSRRGTSRRHRRDTRLRHPPRLYPAMRDHGCWAAPPGRRPDGRREGR